MKRFINLFAATALALAPAVTAAVVPTTASAQRVWRNYDADPAYASQQAAMADRENVFKKWGYNAEEVKAAMEATSKPGMKVKIKTGEIFDHTQEAGRVTMYNVRVGDNPIFKTNGVEALEWTFTVDGKVRHIFLPIQWLGPKKPCYNWSDNEEATSVTPVVVPAAPCVVVRVQIKDEDTHSEYSSIHEWGLGTTAFSDPHKCFGLKRPGESVFHTYTDECIDKMKCDVSETLALFHTQMLFSRTVRTPVPGFYEFRLPREFATHGSDKMVDFCKWGQYPSCGAIVVPGNYHTIDGYDMKVATIWNTAEDIPASMSWARLHFHDPILGQDGKPELDQYGRPICEVSSM